MRELQLRAVKPKTYVDMYKRMRRGTGGMSPVATAIAQGRRENVHSLQTGTTVPEADTTMTVQTSLHQNFTMDDAPRKRWLPRASFLVRHRS